MHEPALTVFEKEPAGQGEQLRSAEPLPGEETKKPSGHERQTLQAVSVVGVQAPVWKLPAGQAPAAVQALQTSDAPPDCRREVKPALQAQAKKPGTHAALAAAQLVQPR